MTGKDNEIRQLFSEERKIDEAFAPTLEQTLARPGRRPVPLVRRLAPLAALALLVTVAVSVLFRHEKPCPAPADTSLLYWESPTAACLGAPGEGVLRLVTAEEGGRAQRGQQ